MARVAYRNADINLMARMMRAEADGEGKQGMLYVGNVIVNHAVANCTDFNDLRTIEQVIFHVQGGNYSFEAVQKGNMFYQRAKESERRLARKNLEYWRTTLQNMPFGTLTHMRHVLQHGTTSLLQGNLNSIVFMNLQLERVIVFIVDD